MYKQPLALLLTACLAMGMTYPAMARDSEDETIGSSETLGVSTELELPTNFQFTLDPFEKAGRGQVYADPLRVINHGEIPVEVSIIDLVCIFTDESIRTVEEVDLFATGNKDIRLALRRTDEELEDDENSQDVELFRMDDGDVYEITEEPGEPITFTLGTSSAAVFELEGSVSPNPSNPWEAGDVSISMRFQYRALVVEDEEPVIRREYERELNPDEIPEEVNPEPQPLLIVTPEPEPEVESELASAPEPEPDSVPDEEPETEASAGGDKSSADVSLPDNSAFFPLPL